MKIEIDCCNQFSLIFLPYFILSFMLNFVSLYTVHFLFSR